MQAALKNSISGTVAGKAIRHHAPGYQSKDDLLLLATNRYCDSDTHDRLSNEQFKEAFYLLIGEVDTGTKQIMARSLSHCAYTPRSIALYFALEPLSIAEPILRHSMALGQLDMLQIVQMKGQDYANLIATRSDIGPSVIRRLKDFADTNIEETLSKNQALVNQGQERSAASLFSSIDETGSKTETAPVETAGHVEPVEETKKTEQTVSISVAEHALLSAASRSGRLDLPAPKTPADEAIPFEFCAAMEQMARARSRQGMAVLMQKKFGLTLETAHQVLDDKTGDTLSVLLRAADVNEPRANRIQLLTHPNIGLSVHNAMRAVRFYARLNVESCQAAVDQWPKAKASTVQHQPYLEDGKQVRTETANKLVQVREEAQIQRNAG